MHRRCIPNEVPLPLQHFIGKTRSHAISSEAKIAKAREENKTKFITMTQQQFIINSVAAYALFLNVP